MSSVFSFLKSNLFLFDNSIKNNDWPTDEIPQKIVILNKEKSVVLPLEKNVPRLNTIRIIRANNKVKIIDTIVLGNDKCKFIRIEYSIDILIR